MYVFGIEIIEVGRCGFIKAFIHLPTLSNGYMLMETLPDIVYRSVLLEKINNYDNQCFMSFYRSVYDLKRGVHS